MLNQFNSHFYRALQSKGVQCQRMKLPLNIFFSFLMVSFITSCGSTRQLQYMQGGFDTAKLARYEVPAPIIQKGDLLSIMVYSDNPTATAIYNQSLMGGNSANATTSLGNNPGLISPVSPGYLVDELGDIQFQGIGKLHVEGLNKSQLTDLLNSRLKDFLQNPYYNIRFLNYKITIIGDVARPGVYTIPTERVNLLEALGLAGDLNITARRENIIIIREQNGRREFGTIDLRQPDLFLSKFYQLQQNDIVYVDLNKNKAAQNDQTTVRNIGLAASIVSTIAIVLTVFRRN
jgi:polysaccharide biosynthesis/export protein